MIKSFLYRSNRPLQTSTDLYRPLPIDYYILYRPLPIVTYLIILASITHATKVYECNLSLKECQEKAGTRTDQWVSNCYLDTSGAFGVRPVKACVETCDPVISNPEKCEDFCTEFEYREDCSDGGSTQPVQATSTASFKQKSTTVEIKVIIGLSVSLIIVAIIVIALAVELWRTKRRHRREWAGAATINRINESEGFLPDTLRRNTSLPLPPPTTIRSHTAVKSPASLQPCSSPQPTRRR